MIPQDQAHGTDHSLRWRMRQTKVTQNYSESQYLITSHFTDSFLGPLPSEARQNVDPAEASRPRFMPSKQHLHEVIKAKMILAGDELQYKGSDDVHCTITVSVPQNSKTQNRYLCPPVILQMLIIYYRSEVSPHATSSTSR